MTLTDDDEGTLPPPENQHCCRPDCILPRGEDEYVIEKAIGRRLAQSRSIGTSNKYDWLVKWEGYDIGEATWQPEDTLGDITALVARFQEDAMIEGMPTDTDDQILLEDAVNDRPEGGWK